jgi:predicted CoA-substrate-specific enzyme activase
MIIAGIDVGTQSIKVVLLSQGNIIASKTLVTEEGGTVGSQIALEGLLSEIGIASSEVGYIMATGVGRAAVALAHKTRTEQLCHARSAYYWFPEARTVLDIGAEGARAMKLDEKGRLKNFVCNSKCAAGTGAFLEVMATLLQVPLEELGDLASHAQHIERVSSYCTVFAESEVISHIHQGKSKEAILAGVIESVAERSFELLQKIGIEPKVVLSGGTVKNIALHSALERMVGQELLRSPDSQIAGALGAALIAQDNL